jgi:hypothetical protein
MFVAAWVNNEEGLREGCEKKRLQCREGFIQDPMQPLIPRQASRREKIESTPSVCQSPRSAFVFSLGGYRGKSI